MQSICGVHGRRSVIRAPQSHARKATVAPAARTTRTCASMKLFPAMERAADTAWDVLQTFKTCENSFSPQCIVVNVVEAWNRGSQDRRGCPLLPFCRCLFAERTRTRIICRTARAIHVLICVTEQDRTHVQNFLSNMEGPLDLLASNLMGTGRGGELHEGLDPAVLKRFKRRLFAAWICAT